MVLAIFVFVLIIAITLLIWQVSNLISIMLGAPAVASPRHELLKEFADPNKTLLDLGCADGNVVISAASLFKHVYGIEASPFYYWLARWKTRKLKNVTIIYGNFFTVDWPHTDYIYCYLLPPLLEKLEPKLKEANTTVLSFGFKIKDWKPKKTIENPDQKLFVY